MTQKPYTLRELHEMVVQAAVCCLISAGDTHLKTGYLEYRDFPKDGWDVVSVELLDTLTGETRFVVGSQNGFSWAENNWSCDCNRMSYFDVHTEDEALGSGECAGSQRFIVIDHVGGLYSTRELNDAYPDELLDRYLPKETVH